MWLVLAFVGGDTVSSAMSVASGLVEQAVPSEVASKASIVFGKKDQP